MLAAAGPGEGLDHLLLLPECVLAMDSAQLKRDLAGLQFSLHLLSDGPHGSVWLSGATPVDGKQQNGKPSSAKQGLHWFAECGTSPDVNDGTPRRPARRGGARWLSEDLDTELNSLEGKEGQQQLDREERLRLLRERQNEERQRKLEELKQQALAAQKFREQKEEERRRRLEELRVRDTDRRHQVEERKRQIWEAERDRREAILRKNQEREARIESKRKNERSSIVFAFGSSTPRMLEPGDTGSTYWATRRATSTTNVMTLSLSAAPGPLTRRSSERELDGGSKKRATSAGCVERKPQEATEVRRRKTDLTPTVPERDSTPPRTPVRGKPGGVRSGEITPSRPTSSMSQHSVSSQLSTASLRARTPRRPRPVSIAVTGVSSPGSERGAKSPVVSSTDKPPIPKVHSAKKSTPSRPDGTLKKTSDKNKSAKSSASTTPKGPTPLQSPMVESADSGMLLDLTREEEEEDRQKEEEGASFNVGVTRSVTPEPAVRSLSPPQEAPAPQEEVAPSAPIAQPLQPVQPVQPEVTVSSQQQANELSADLAEVDMTASMIAKIRITTEEEAKAALAERRRLAREQAEREAELERQRLEAERLAEEERIRKEEEEQKRMEEEQLRLLEEARKSEELRLQQAIEEAKKREEEEKKRKEEELKQKIEKEEADKKAKEEAEKMRIEMEIRLKKEEEDRQARRKRVEAIMLRTRGRGSTTNATTPSKDGEESEENSPPDEAKKTNENDQFLNSERSHSDANTVSPLVESNKKHNGHHNGSMDSVTENNVTNSLLDLSTPGEILELPTGNGKLPETPPFIENNQSHPVNDLLS